MSDDEIIRMANEAGWDAVNLDDGFGTRLKRFAELARRTTEPIKLPPAWNHPNETPESYAAKCVQHATATLRAEVERLREALEAMLVEKPIDEILEYAEEAKKKARAALKEPK